MAIQMIRIFAQHELASYKVNDSIVHVEALYILVKSSLD